MKKNVFKPLEKQLGYTFKDKELLTTALTHKTYAFEAPTPVEYNERLEFLGDSILNFILSETLYQSNQYFSEGELSRRRAQVVNNSVLTSGRVFCWEKGSKSNRGRRTVRTLRMSWKR